MIKKLWIIGHNVGRSLGLVPKVIYQRQKAIRVFKRQLRQAGLNEQAIGSLAGTYKSIGSISKLPVHINKS